MFVNDSLQDISEEEAEEAASRQEDHSGQGN